jgi:hypothetical protein
MPKPSGVDGWLPEWQKVGNAQKLPLGRKKNGVPEDFC